MSQEIAQRIDRMYPRLDPKLRTLLIQLLQNAENAKQIRHTPDYEPYLANAAARFLTLLFDESYKVREDARPTIMAY